MKAKISLCGIVLLLLGAGNATDLKKELDKFQGTWTVHELTYSGSEQDKLKFSLVFKGDEAVIEGDDQVKQEYARIKIKLDPSATPKLFDVTVGAGVQKDASMEGIYEFKDKDLRLCVKVFGKNRPTEFASPDGSSVVLLVLKRP